MRSETRVKFNQWEREQFKLADENFCKKNKATLFSALELPDESDKEEIYSSKYFTVSPSALVTIEEKTQESNDFLNKINVITVDEQSGYTVGEADFVGTASTTNTYEYDREPWDGSSGDYYLDKKIEIDAHNAYFCEQTNFDVSFSYSRLDTLANRKNFSESLNNQLLVRRGLDRIAIGFNGTHRSASSNRTENKLLQDVNVGWLQHLRDRNQKNCLTELLPGSGQIKVGKNVSMSEGYSSIDNLASDLFYTLMPLRYRETSEMVVLTGRENTTNKYTSLLDETKDIPTELVAFNLLNSLSKCPLWRLSVLILGHGSGAKENAPAELAYVGSGLRLPDPPYVLITYGHLNIMIYTFLIAASRGRIADISRVRTISAFAKSEQEARARLSGLPLVFMSRTPVKAEAASC